MMTKVLIVEDEPAIAESLSFALRRDGFSVDWADSLGAAADKLARVELILLDLMLPDGSGFDLIVQLRREGLKVAIIVLSSRDDEADRVAALESGADDYVTKPFSPREVVARVRAVLRRAQTDGPVTPNTVTKASAVRVDSVTRRAFVHGVAVDLTRVEFDLLACLARESGRVFTRAQLIDKVWGDGFAITDRTVDSHIKGLRKKLTEVGADANVVETVRGVGYRVVADIAGVGVRGES